MYRKFLCTFSQSLMAFDAFRTEELQTCICVYLVLEAFRFCTVMLQVILVGQLAKAL